MVRFITVALLALTLAGPARADSTPAISRISGVTGNNIYESCKKHGPFCLAYVTGSADMASIWSLLGKNIYFCIPYQVDGNQLMDLVSKYMHDHPQDRHINAITLFTRAMEKAWPGPCRKK